MVVPVARSSSRTDVKGRCMAWAEVALLLGKTVSGKKKPLISTLSRRRFAGGNEGRNQG